MFDVVDLIVDDKQIAVSRNLSVKGDDQTSGTVVVDNQVMHSMHKRMGKDDLLDFFHQIFLRSLVVIPV